MRLINVRTLVMHDFVEPPGWNDYPESNKYAILSHRWEDDEVTFQGFQDFATRQGRAGYEKVRQFRDFVISRNQKWHQDGGEPDRVKWIWVDTCCIDKTSSAELSEAINSMWTWYRKADYCVAYLSDVDVDVRNLSTKYERRIMRKFQASEWFRRGWTLQELLAPCEVIFCSSKWQIIGWRAEEGALSEAITKATGIDGIYLRKSVGYLDFFSPLDRASTAEKMSWAAKRQTTRVEDTAYCLMGLFDINMPLLYGEGMRAFRRLQEEIIKQSDDESIFSWASFSNTGLLAESPAAFAKCGDIVKWSRTDLRSFNIVSRSLRWETSAIEMLPTLAGQRRYAIALNCVETDVPKDVVTNRYGPYYREPNARSKSRGCLLFLCESTKGSRIFFREGSECQDSILDLSDLEVRQRLAAGTWSARESVLFDIMLDANVYSAGFTTGLQDGSWSRHMNVSRGGSAWLGKELRLSDSEHDENDETYRF